MIELKECPFCKANVGWYEADPGAPFPGYYLMIVHLGEDSLNDHDNRCAGNQIDISRKVCSDFSHFSYDLEGAKARYHTREQAEKELAALWNRRE